MHLDQRKRRILQAIIDEYIDTAEPVGSRSIARKHELGLSSATIRNEMADLSDMGFLAQPHTSAGRIPSDKGYRLYVDSLMETRNLTIEEIRDLTNEIDLRITELGTLIKRASAVISKLTKYTAVTVTPKQDDSIIAAIEAVGIGGNKICVITVSKSGTVKNSVASPHVGVPDKELAAFLIACRKHVCGSIPDRLTRTKVESIRMAVIAGGVRDEVCAVLLTAVLDCARQMGGSEVYLDGTTNIMNFPEFQNVDRAREFLEILEERKSIANLLSELAKDEHIKMLIGNENPIAEIQGCSIIGATYSIGNTVFGTIGIIGPKRMEYAKVVSMIEYINRMISGEVNRLMGEDSG